MATADDLGLGWIDNAAQAKGLIISATTMLPGGREMGLGCELTGDKDGDVEMLIRLVQSVYAGVCAELGQQRRD